MLAVAVARRTLWLAICTFLLCEIVPAERSFEIRNDRFWRDGKPFQVISGSIHYFRIHQDYWLDRLLRVKAVGLNTISVYVPWNFHEQTPGVYDFSGRRDVVRFLGMASDLELLVILRPGPYICSEWDMGGLPWWLASSQVSGGREMEIRSADERYMQHVRRWWDVLFGQLGPLLYERGGPLVMTQVENELGFFGQSMTKLKVDEYLRALIAFMRSRWGERHILFTTDPPWALQWGTLAGGEVYSVVDFYPGTNLTDAFDVKQKSFNLPGLSPPFVSEFYTGFHPHWGERMHQTDANLLVTALADVLRYANNSGNVNFYMFSGGTNFGLWAGAAWFGLHYAPIATSYDSGYPLSEAGDAGQPGLHQADNKYLMIRATIGAHTQLPLPPLRPPPVYHPYGGVILTDKAFMLDVLPQLYSGDGIYSHLPLTAEEYGMRCGLVLYRTKVATALLSGGGELTLWDKIHDYGKVLLNGVVVGHSDRSQPNQVVLLPPVIASGEAALDILVEAFGRNNFFSSAWDLKGIIHPNITLNGVTLEHWHVFPLPLDDLPCLWRRCIKPEPQDAARASQRAASATLNSSSALPPTTRSTVSPSFTSSTSMSASSASAAAAQRRIMSSGLGQGLNETLTLTLGPMFWRGWLDIPVGAPRQSSNPAILADSYLDTSGWGKGMAWVNGFCLGWYWPSQGPQMTLYVPGPLLHEGPNEIMLLELDQLKEDLAVNFVDTMNWGPVDPPPAEFLAVGGGGSYGRGQ